MKAKVLYRVISIRRQFHDHSETEEANIVVTDLEGYRKVVARSDERIFFVYDLIPVRNIETTNSSRKRRRRCYM